MNNKQFTILNLVQSLLYFTDYNNFSQIVGIHSFLFTSILVDENFDAFAYKLWLVEYDKYN